MAILDRTTLDGKSPGWSSKITQDSKTKTYTISTEGKYVDKDISLEVNIKDAIINNTGSVTGINCTLISSEDTNTSGISVTGSGTTNITSAGWIESDYSSSDKSTKYITGITLENNKTFKIDDGIYNWTVSKDSNGNVFIE